MLVDSHRHWYPDQEAISTHIARAMEAYFHGGAAEGEGVASTWADPGGTKLLAEMDLDGIDMSCLLVAGFEFDQTNVVDRFDSMNQATTELAQQHPDRFRVYVGVHPAMNPTTPMLRRLLGSDVAVGVKMDPLGGRFDPMEGALEPVYRYCAENGRRILFHLGPRPDGVDLSAHPAAMTALLERYPTLHIIGAHAAFEWWRDMCEAGERHPSLACDISGLQYAASRAPAKVAHLLSRVMGAFGPERVLFGTDSPTFDSEVSVATWLSYLRQVAKEDSALGVSSDDVTAVLHNSFAITDKSLV